VYIAQPRKISDIKPLFTNLAQTSHYQVIFGGLSPDLKLYLARKGVDAFFIAESVGLLCSDASLPGSTHDTAQVAGNYTGAIETFAHTRIFTEIQLQFLIDKEYKVLKFLEHWIEYISSGSRTNPSNPGYFYRMKYPIDYKCNQTKILKFDRDYTNEVRYNFFGMFPKSLSSLSVSYNESQILTASASFNYERYVLGNISSLELSNNQIQLNQSTTNNPAPNVALAYSGIDLLANSDPNSLSSSPALNGSNIGETVSILQY